MLQSLFDIVGGALGQIGSIPWVMLKTAASLTNKVLTQSDRSIKASIALCGMGSNTPAAAPSWSSPYPGFMGFNPSDYGGKATFNATALGPGAILSTAATSMQAGWQIKDQDSSVVIAAGQDASATTQHRSIEATTFTPSNLTDGANNSLRFQDQRVSGASGTLYPHQVRIDIQDA